MGILINPSEAPGPGVAGWCYKYNTREQVRIDTIKKSRYKRKHRDNQAGDHSKKATKAEKAKKGQTPTPRQVTRL